MKKKIGLSSLIFLILCFSAFGIEIEKFNKGTVKNDWTDDFPLKNKGSFEMLPHLHQINLMQMQVPRNKHSIQVSSFPKNLIWSKNL